MIGGATAFVLAASAPALACSWADADLSDIAGAPPAGGNPFGYSTDLTGQGPIARVDYRTATGHIEELSVQAGRFVLLGDAARICPPASGMGLNLSLHDATVAARFLADAISEGDKPAALDQYEQACRLLAERLLAPDLATI